MEYSSTESTVLHAETTTEFKKNVPTSAVSNARL